jgi:hypothetical protein
VLNVVLARGPDVSMTSVRAVDPRHVIPDRELADLAAEAATHLTAALDSLTTPRGA